MSNTISWNLQLSVKDGQFDAARELMLEMVTATKDESGCLNYEWYLSSDGKHCHINESYADSSATMIHLGNFGVYFIGRFMTCFKPSSMSVYGEPSAEVRAALDGMGAIYLNWFGGFKR